MKRAIMILAATFFVASAYGQNIRSKNGERVLPQAQDWSIGIDANPFFSYLKGLIGNGQTNTGTAPTFNYLLNNQIITGKYFIQSDLAARASLRLGFRGNTNRNMVADRSATGAPTFPDLAPMVENEWSQRGSTLGLSVGLEKRRGNTRLQGFYGGELGVYTNSNRNEFSYANALQNGASPIAATSDDAFAGSGNIVTNDGYGNIARVTEFDFGRTFQFGVRGFIGAEYFIFPKISIGGEFGWGIGFQSTKGARQVRESYNPTTDEVGTQTIETGDSNGFALDTDNQNSMFGRSGNIRISLHF